MNPLFAAMGLWMDPVPRSGAMNMAVDEVLLSRIRNPLLRVYKWADPTVSFGYFEKLAAVRAAYPTWNLVRRWTGGGVVEHGKDLTYSVLVPVDHPFFKVRTAISYLQIHMRVVEVLEAFGLAPTVAASHAPKVSSACFENPAQHDVLIDGRKIAGAAQRRSRLGFLHQGSIQIPHLPDDFARELAVRLAGAIGDFSADQETLAAAETLGSIKYDTQSWLEKF